MSGFRTIACNIRAFEGQVFMTEQTLFLIATYDSIFCVIIEGPSLGCSSCRKHFDGQLHQTPATAMEQMSGISVWPLTGVFVCEVDQFMRCHRPLITPALCTVKPSAASQIELSWGKWGSTSHTAGTWFKREESESDLSIYLSGMEYFNIEKIHSLPQLSIFVRTPHEQELGFI